ncbi:hypothetical protein ACUY28_05880 [Corynebacterium sanguinis]|uniref:Uncharacterized protein n=1 Tax=Corynebacterium sanguinis TaxID=2594913 RepID=A0A6C1TZQ9_9CORY|nr:hypothetical protein [Corynebacterium sanguinis]MCT1555857.1 hypothetical protein [Corynebacterium sanguinis]MCT1613746.1 hypothetical protein [Corynebacterium sanguinis]MCT2023842.1 hypothetical protein [Corynebacterium sanguinis]MDN8621870.1 hypothetical protein [Corynebacterium sanguinis]TVS27663.1 hypothetical protein EKI59_08565 [Corynebacterium sanguinis]
MTTPQNPNETGRVARVRQTTTRRATGQAPAGSESHAYETETTAADNDTTGQEAWIGTDATGVSNGNVSWGAIFAGVVTFLGLMILLGVGAAAMGLQGSSAAATGVFTVISLAIAFAAAGYVAGALGVRAGFFHGFAAWATSLIAALVLTGWLGASVVGGLGSALGTVGESAGNAVSVNSQDAQAAQDAVDPQEAQNAAQQAQQTAQEAAQQAQQTAQEVAPEVAAGSWWTFAGLIIGALISAFAGAAGARSVLSRDEKQVVRPANR